MSKVQGVNKVLIADSDTFKGALPGRFVNHPETLMKI